jgi:hypothetical protein
MGNRGRLHDEEGRIRRSWQVKRWLICRLEFNGRHRVVMAPNRYTELFFLDEATGLAAGHRPCFECRRTSYNSFVDVWFNGNSENLGRVRPTAESIDERLHAERLGPARFKRTFTANIDELPHGVFVTLDEDEGRAYLIWEGRILEWSPGGYKHSRPLPDGEVVSVLTPASTVAAIRAGYIPEVHPSAKIAWTT